MTGARDGRTHPRCPDCGTVWRQSGNRTGHCSGCHLTFTSAAAFDRHRVDDEAGNRTCRDPGAVFRTEPDGTRVAVYDVIVTNEPPASPHLAYWALHTTDEQRAAFAKLNDERTARARE